LLLGVVWPSSSPLLEDRPKCPFGLAKLATDIVMNDTRIILRLMAEQRVSVG